MNLDKIVINWHLTQRCNFACKHCFATKHAGDGICVADSTRSSKELLCKIYKAFSQEYSGIRLNIAGGEPFLVPNLNFIIKEARNIGFEVSMISNGSLLAGLGTNSFDTCKWIEKNACHLCLFGISVDSLKSETNAKIGRVLLENSHQRAEKIAKMSENSRPQTLSPQDILKIARLLRASNDKIALKINTVVTKHNYTEYLGDFIYALKPEKWKVLQALSIDTPQIFCTDEQFEAFVKRHKGFEGVISVESRQQMTNSYLMLDEFGRFYQNENSHYSYSPCVLEMSEVEILRKAYFDKVKFQKRYSGGVK